MKPWTLPRNSDGSVHVPAHDLLGPDNSMNTDFGELLPKVENLVKRMAYFCHPHIESATFRLESREEVELFNLFCRVVEWCRENGVVRMEDPFYGLQHDFPLEEYYKIPTRHKLMRWRMMNNKLPVELMFERLLEAINSEKSSES